MVSNSSFAQVGRAQSLVEEKSLAQPSVIELRYMAQRVVMSVVNKAGCEQKSEQLPSPPGRGLIFDLRPPRPPQNVGKDQLS
jgi:hypothetical protein